MTTQSERIRQQHRGTQLAAPASASRIASLKYHGLRYEMIDDATTLVENEFVFNLKGSHWRSTIDSRCHGYLVGSLVAEIRKRNLAKPAAGRDGVTVGGRTASTITGAPTAIAESAAGSPSSDLLPVVSP